MIFKQHKNQTAESIKTILSFHQVDVSYEATTLILKNITFSLNNQASMTIIGASGVGKSSIFKTIFRQTQLVNGDVWFLNQSLKQTSKKNWRKLMRQVGYLSAESSLFEQDLVYHTIKREFLSFQPWWQQMISFLNYKQRLKIFQVLEDLNLLNKAFAPIKNLSQGQKQRIEIAKLLIKQPKLILADEPTSALDHKHAVETIQLIKRLANQYNCSLIINIHDISLLKHASEITLALQKHQVYFIKPTHQVNQQDLSEVY